MHVHFIGFRKDREYWQAVSIWGKPDFIHMIHDRRAYGDIADCDVVIFGSKGTTAISAYNWQDHEIW